MCQAEPEHLKAMDINGKTNAEIWVSQIKQYIAIVDNVVLNHQYSPNLFCLQLKIKHGVDGIPYISSINAYYKPQNIDARISVKVTQYNSAIKAQDLWLNKLKNMSNPWLIRISDKGINIGDIGIGSTSNIEFIRANVSVSIESDLREFSILEMAQEIDQQILDSIAEKEKNEH